MNSLVPDSTPPAPAPVRQKAIVAIACATGSSIRTFKGINQSESGQPFTLEEAVLATLTGIREHKQVPEGTVRIEIVAEFTD